VPLIAEQDPTHLQNRVSQRLYRNLAVGLGISISTFCCAFVLPFCFPLTNPVMSPAYAAGANNRVGAAAVAAMSVLVFMAYYWRNSDNPEQEDPTDQFFSIGYFGGGVIAMLTFTAVLAFFVARAIEKFTLALSLLMGQHFICALLRS
jgi:hypothetical protein